MGCVLSVQKHTITLTAGTSSDTAALTGNPASDTGNCVPFVTTRVTDPHATPDQHRAYQVSVSFTGSSPNINVQCETDGTGGETGREVVCEVTVVEFGSNISVQTGALSLAGTTSDTLSAPGDFTAVDSLSRAFMYHTWLNGISSDDFRDHCLRGELTAEGTLAFSRADNDGTMTGNWWIIESLGPTHSFEVEHLSVDIADTSAQQVESLVSINPVDMAKTAVFGNHSSSNASDDNSNATGNMFLSSTTQVTADRSGTSNSWSGLAQIVEFADDTNVYRGNIDPTDGDDTATVTSVDDTESLVHVPGGTGSFVTGSFAGTASDDPPNAHCALTFNSGTQIRVQHNTTGSTDVGDVSWEVIEWDTSASGPPRRVMVVG